MGVTYSSYLRVVIDMGEADLIEQVKKTTTVCDHEHSAKFCPECGTKATDRTMTKEVKQFTKAFRHLTKYLDIEEYADREDGPDEDVYAEPDLHTILYEWEGAVGLRSFKLARLGSSYEDRDAPLALIADISKVGGYGAGSRDIHLGDLEVALEQARKLVAKLGLDREPRIVHMMRAG